MTLTEKKIVMIDDDRKLLDLTSRYLKEHGWLVFAGTDSSSGRELIKQHNPVLVVLDVMMPETSGFDLCSEIRAQSDVPNYHDHRKGRSR